MNREAKDISRHFGVLTSEEFRDGIAAQQARDAEVERKMREDGPVRDDFAAINASSDRVAHEKAEYDASLARELFARVLLKVEHVRARAPDLAKALVAEFKKGI